MVFSSAALRALRISFELAPVVLVSILCGAHDIAGATPGEATNLRWCPGTGSCLEWDAAVPPGNYRIVRGTAASLQGLVDAAVDSCALATFSGTSTGSVLNDAPPVGDFYWYLVVATTCAADGTAGEWTGGPRILNSSGDCAPASCSDGLRDGTESDVDCGGASCGGCAPGQHCCAGSDCSSLLCIAEACAGATCVDGIRNGNETDIDCGGGTCPSCAGGMQCAISSDCTSHVCTGGRCALPSCTDGVQNGNETDIDCGGSCPACANGRQCSVDSDCQSGFCVSGLCQVPYCPDTDGDGCYEFADCCSTNCGTIPGRTGDGTLANPYSDCTGVTVCAYCTTTSGILASCGNFGGCRVCGMPCLTSCTDGVQNGNETDVDCGGGCAACANGKKCNVAADCESTFCQSGVCQLPPCPDTDGDGCYEPGDFCRTNCADGGHSGSGTLNDPYSDCIGVTTCAYCTTTSGVFAFCGQNGFGGRACGMTCQP